jgi:hypothetical protein
MAWVGAGNSTVKVPDARGSGGGVGISEMDQRWGARDRADISAWWTWFCQVGKICQPICITLGALVFEVLPKFQGWQVLFHNSWRCSNPMSDGSKFVDILVDILQDFRLWINSLRVYDIS